MGRRVVRVMGASSKRAEDSGVSTSAMVRVISVERKTCGCL